MKFLTSVIIISSLVMVTNLAYAQDGSTVEQIRNYTRGQYNIFEDEDNVIGSPYLFDNFINGEILFSNGRTSQELPLRFDTYRNSIQIQDKNQIFTIEEDLIQEITLFSGENIILLQKGFSGRGVDNDDFLQVLEKGHLSFIVKTSTNLRQNSGNYGSANQERRYTSSDTYYLQVDGKELDRLRRLNERFVLRAIPSNEEELKRYANENSLQFDNPDDVAKLINYYNNTFVSE